MREETFTSGSWVRDLEAQAGIAVYAQSLRADDNRAWFAARRGTDRILGLAWGRGGMPEALPGGDRYQVGQAPVEEAVAIAWSPGTAAWAQSSLPVGRVCLLDARPSFGFGDRLSRATPGHLRAARGSGWFPVLAQQSIREMTRTGRNPQGVMDDALWGALVEGLADAFGTDADHLKEPDDVRSCLEAGFRMFTVDPGDHVDDEGAAATGTDLEARYDALPWADLDDSAADCRSRYLDRAFPGGGPLKSAEALARAAVKYGRAVAHTRRLAVVLVDHLGRDGFDLEMSVDETETPTTPLEHYYIATELGRLGVRLSSLAPRFVGRFEKGIDYIGSIEGFEETLRWHAAIANDCGGYRLSLHSGSDKFSVYPVARRVLGNALHVKTAGTSYLEAVRTVARCEPDMFRRILEIARDRYDIDRATYHVSAETSRLPDPARVRENDIPSLLDDPNARQILHVTYGSIVGTDPVDPGLRERFFQALDDHEEDHWTCVESHLNRHIEALSPGES